MFTVPDGGIELRDGDAYSGNLFMSYNETFYPVCVNGWSAAESDVVCRQLGLGTGSFMIIPMRK